MARPDAQRAREQRVIAGGSVVLATALLLTFGVLPFVRQWRAREAEIETTRARVTYLRDLTSRTAALEAAARDAERALSVRRRRVLHARSSTLAASALQTYLQDAADANHVVVSRLEVTPGDSVGDQASGDHVPATLSVYGDIRGATGLLKVLATGPRVLSVDRVVMTRNTALAGASDVVQVAVTIRAPVLPP